MVLAADEWLTPQEVAGKLKVHINTIYRWIDSGKLKAFRAGDMWRIRDSDLNEFLSRQPSEEE